jgi:hypothetical protein
MFRRFGVLCGNLPHFLVNYPSKSERKVLKNVEIGLLFAIIRD